MKFRDRKNAGQLLAKQLSKFANQVNTLVMALPRGGVPIGYEIAQELKIPLDVFIVRKLGVPWHPELAFGAISVGNVSVYNQEILDSLKLSSESMEQVKKNEMAELERRNTLYREGRSLPDLTNQTVILVDDGIATGATMKAAIAALKKLGCKEIVVAAPVAPPETVKELAKEVDKIVCLITPENLYAISIWYEEFNQTSDDEVRELLHENRNTLH